MKNRLEYIVFILFGRFFQLLGLNLSRKLAGSIAAIFFYLIPIRKKTVIANLKMAFPGYSDAIIKNIAFNNYKNFAIVLIEILLIPTFSRDEINKAVSNENLNMILDKFKENKGIITLSAHFGNWEYMAASVSSQLNIKSHLIIKPLRNPFVDNWMNLSRTKWVNEVIPMGISIRKSYLVLKDKGALAILGDQRGPEEGIKLNFFGKETSVYTGPAIFSLRTGAQLLFIICIRQPDYSYKIIVHELNHDNLPEDENEKVAELTKRYIFYLEKYIKEYPDQWLWMHKRWKH